MKIVISILCDRYEKLAADDEYLLNMISILRDADWPFDKVCRWIGFIQGVLYERGIITIEKERNFTRPIFHDYYRRHGIPIPKSASVEE